jgi:hypothetical protein
VSVSAQRAPNAPAIVGATVIANALQVPLDATSGQTIHALIQVTDNGAPPLTTFRRVIVTVYAP